MKCSDHRVMSLFGRSRVSSDVACSGTCLSNLKVLGDSTRTGGFFSLVQVSVFQKCASKKVVWPVPALKCV